MGNYILNLTQISMKEAVRCMSNNAIYFSTDSHNTVSVLTENNLAYSINKDAKYYASRGLRKLEG